MMISGLTSVTAMFCGKVYGLLGRSTVMLLPWGMRGEEGVDATQHTVMPVAVPSHLQGCCTVVEHVV